MNTVIDDKLSSLSRVWVYQSSRLFTQAEADTIAEMIKGFVKQWTAHKMEVTGDGSLVHNRFIVLAADETHVGVSGCSVDSSVNFIRSIGNQFNVNFFDRWQVAYIKDGEVMACNHQQFEELLQQGVVNEDTIVFNNLVQTKAELDAKWQVSYKNHWLKNVAGAHTSFSSVL